MIREYQTPPPTAPWKSQTDRVYGNYWRRPAVRKWPNEEENQMSKRLRKIVITGSNGIIGQVLASGLSGYQLTLADLPTGDIRDFRLCSKILRRHDAVIHLAWNTKDENWQSPLIDQNNTTMFSNVCRAALAENVRRVIVASSVHVEQYRKWSRRELISPQRDPIPFTVPTAPTKFSSRTLGAGTHNKGSR